MITLGIDPGTAQMGWGIVERKEVAGKKPKVLYVSHGMITTPSTDPLSKRLVVIRDGVADLVSANGVDEIVIERVVFNVNKKSAISVAQAYGVVMLLAGERDLPVYEYNALEAKLHLTGHGRAEKKDVQSSLKTLFKMEKHPTPVHAADALAIALCHIAKTSNLNS
ncbi:MAG: Crossover junction endodeoxyribonuclease RuvC [candidate division CPR1 bacterium GW2011_GWC1_49_13]|uniref:Crossover junction endodeoxyribonuclease RuvC n=1 Tax=candidate division CPR1 bacterium GW2011_GWC1_49_13 TaxID=1618342 RepID=A0A0G1VG65_9BACT|nr:MAG: Crossover junction endodeoxyribonuclease RuvC [candidate division CPR1 bacterium GW2011_GWC1_49_13]